MTNKQNISRSYLEEAFQEMERIEVELERASEYCFNFGEAEQSERYYYIRRKLQEVIHMLDITLEYEERNNILPR